LVPSKSGDSLITRRRGRRGRKSTFSAQFTVRSLWTGREGNWEIAYPGCDLQIDVEIDLPFGDFIRVQSGNHLLRPQQRLPRESTNQHGPEGPVRRPEFRPKGACAVLASARVLLKPGNVFHRLLWLGRMGIEAVDYIEDCPLGFEGYAREDTSEHPVSLFQEVIILCRFEKSVYDCGLKLPLREGA